MTATALKYDIHDKDMLAIVFAINEWRRYLEGAEHPILVISDHENLEHCYHDQSTEMPPGKMGPGRG
jgi:hypothetical protein